LSNAGITGGGTLLDFNHEAVAQVDLYGLAVDLNHHSLDVSLLPRLPELALRPRLGHLSGERLPLDGDAPSGFERHSAIFGLLQAITLAYRGR